MAKKQSNYSQQQLSLGLTMVTAQLEVLKSLIKEKIREKEWLQTQLNNLKDKEDEKRC